MKAIVQRAYGQPEDVLALQDVEAPIIKDDEVLVHIRAASVHPDVWHVVTGRPYVLRVMGSGLRRPKNRVAGTDLAGVVEHASEPPIPAEAHGRPRRPPLKRREGDTEGTKTA